MKQIRFIHRLARLFVPPLMYALGAVLAHAQSLDTSGATMLGNQFVTLALFVAAAGVVVAFAVSIFMFMGHRISGGIMWLTGAIVGGYLVGRATNWGSTLTGVTFS